MCADCLQDALDSLPAPLANRELKRAQRMFRSGQSMIHIGRVLGVNQPTVQAALQAA